jgi:rod shape-determining protein MreC
VFETRGDDGMFPEGTPIGTVTKVIPIEGETYQNVKLKLAEDFGSIYNVTVVKNYKGKEQLELEQQTMNEFVDESNN